MILAAAGGGGGGGGTVIPGDPAELARLAGIYAAAAGGLGDAAAQLQASFGHAGDWQGVGAQAHTSRAQALAGAHQVGRDALYLAAQALSNYAIALAQAQALARQANAAGASAAATAVQLAQVQTSAATASTVSPDIPAEARFGTAPSPYQQDRARGAQLQSALSDQQGQAASMGAQALTMAATAANRAAAAFSEVASLASAPTPGAGRSLMTSISGINDKAGWVLNASGVAGAAVSSTKMFGWITANNAYREAAAAENESFDAWGAQGGYFAWAKDVEVANETWREAQGARIDMERSVAPAGDDWSVLGTLGKVGLVGGMASDAVTIADPSPSFGPDGLLGGTTDQTMAGLNLAASGLALGDTMGIGLATTALAIPGVDVIAVGVLAGTAVYFAGEFVYAHWDDITHAASSVGHWAGHELDGAEHTVSDVLSFL